MTHTDLCNVSHAAGICPDPAGPLAKLREEMHSESVNTSRAEIQWAVRWPADRPEAMAEYVIYSSREVAELYIRAFAKDGPDYEGEWDGNEPIIGTLVSRTVYYSDWTCRHDF